MKETAEAVIIGGGIHGTSIAYHLAERGCTDVVLLEKNTIASGPTGITFGLIRQHYSYDFMVQIVKKSLDIFKRFELEVDSAIDFVQNGFILAGTDEERPAMESTVRMQNRLGVDAVMLDPREIKQLIRGINVDGIQVACYERESGYADGYAAAMGFARKARALGAKLYEDRPATSIRMEHNKVNAVATPQGEIETRYVINAAGPWAKEVASWVGVELPIELDLLQEALVEPKVLYKKHTPTLIDLSSMIYFRPETGGRLIVGGGTYPAPKPAGTESYASTPSDDFIHDIATRLAKRMPELADAFFIRAWAGLIDKTPDHHPIVGRIDGVDGFIVSCGYSGHGFKEAPMMSQLIAEEVLDGKATTIDISPLNFSRFEKQRLLFGRYKKFPILA